MRGPTRGVPEALRCADRGRRGRTYPQVRGEIATCAACFPSGHCHLVAGRGSDAGRATRSRPWGTAGLGCGQATGRLGPVTEESLLGTPGARHRPPPGKWRQGAQPVKPLASVALVPPSASMPGLL